MRELTIDRNTLRAFDDDVLQNSITMLELLCRSARNADVPIDAYTRTEAGEIAHRGHTETLRVLNKLIDDLRTTITDFALRARQTTDNYQTAEDQAVRSASSMQTQEVPCKHPPRAISHRSLRSSHNSA